MAELSREIKHNRFVTRGDRGLEVTESRNSSFLDFYPNYFVNHYKKTVI
jgi:hypothetical protein